MENLAQNFPNLMDMLVNLATRAALPALGAGRYLCLIAGIWFVFMGLMHVYGASDPESSRFMGGRTQSSYSLAFGYVLAGTLLTSMYRLDVVGVLQGTLINGDAAVPINSAQLQYGGGGALQERIRVATFALMALMQFIGFVAIARGIMMIKDVAAGHQNASIGGIFIFLVAGTMLWHFEYFANAINGTLGYDFIGLFSPYR
jgi:hypothetical protein